MNKYQPSEEQLEVGKRYEFSDDMDEWRPSTLLSVDCSTDYNYDGCEQWYRYIREDQSIVGKIKEKSVELIEGEWYMCEIQHWAAEGCSYEPRLYRSHSVGFGAHVKGVRVTPLYRLVRAED